MFRRSCEMPNVCTLFHYLKITVIKSKQTALCGTRILLDVAPVVQVHVCCTPPLYAATQMPVHNLKIITGGKWCQMYIPNEVFSPKTRVGSCSSDDIIQ
jgi:hypothetical protein